MASSSRFRIQVLFSPTDSFSPPGTRLGARPQLIAKGEQNA